MSASATTGVISPPGIDTATEMSARLKLSRSSPANCDVALGHLDQRLGERLDQHVVDAELDAAALEAGVELAAQLEQRVELDVDGEIDVRDLLLRPR